MAWESFDYHKEFFMNIRDALTDIYQTHGVLTPQIVVDEARPETSPIHSQFEWDDQAAAESYRRVQAAHLIRSVRINFQHGDEAVSVRGFLPAHLDDDETTSAYHPTEKVFQDPVSRHVLLKEMERDWKAFKDKYRHFQEFADLIASEERNLLKQAA